jgi:hypothetical protein
MAKLPAKKKKKEDQVVVIPDAVEAVPTDGSVEEDFDENAFGEIKDAHKVRFTVKLDNKKIEGRTLDQAQSIFYGVAGSVKKIIIEEE